jgi:prevent-host-death family protein
MREMTASEASRNFSALLDSVEHGETVNITRSGRRVAQLAPISGGNGASIRAVFDRWQGTAVDDQFASQVAAARAASGGELDVDPWKD